MSTTTMMSNHHRRFPTPSVGVGPSSKRKERDGFDVPKPSTNRKQARPGPAWPAPKPPEPALNNQLVAGYLAHEFLTKGTLFGQPWDPARAEAVPVSAASAEQPRRLKSSSFSQKARAEAEPQVDKYQRYVEVTGVINAHGAHLPGIVNPSQLARFLQM